MNNFKIIYKILASLEAQLDLDKTNIELISPAKLGISENRWRHFIQMLLDSGYIKGVKIYTDVTGETNVQCNDIGITLQGLEYLQENSTMQQIKNALKGIKEITPGL